MTEITRRSLLLSAAAMVAAPMLPQMSIAGTATVGVDMAKGADMMAFAVGTPGEYDWISVFARTPEEAWREWCNHQWGTDEQVFDPDYVSRVEVWDGLEIIRPTDWLRAGLGHHCDRCSGETDIDSGGRIVCDEVVCEDCLTVNDRLVIDPDGVVDTLADEIADEGAEAVQAHLECDGIWGSVSPDLWARAVALAGDA